ncbi:restriction endonuclease subunit S [Serinibacter salmoneus]|uniref:Type I restriction enzyme S subunit n=1 Tax=Serinibacter salmoneus TaxID=556530 RepID=A0A2A9D2U7_9MICO|nr:restriction endonuclease subunit S [Serinibacter salmoneus]PFG20666.1 type I restriction enzyme S subunit [Serinibacter salmoneus]
MSGALPEGWRGVRLGDVVTISHGFAFPGAGFGSNLDSPQVLTPRNFRVGGGFQSARPKSFEGEYPAKFLLRGGELVVSMTDLSKASDTLGAVAVLPRGQSFLHNQRIGLLECDPGVIPRFLEYRLRLGDYRKYVLSGATGSTVRHTSPGRIQAFQFLLPPLAQQQAIADVLGALDDKIAANARTADIAQRLAAGLHQRAVQGCASRRVVELAVVTMGTSPKGAELNELGNGLPFYQGVRDFGLLFPSRRVYTTAPVRTAVQGDVLLSVRAPVGELNFATESCSIGRGLAALTAIGGLKRTLFFSLKAEGSLWSEYDSTGTVFGSISGPHLRNGAVRWPSNPEMLESQLEPLMARAEFAELESASLSEVRDALLPALMSGRLTVREAERVAENVT